MIVPLLEILFNHWMEQGTIPQHFTRFVVKLIHKNKHEGGENLSFLALNDAELKILAKVLANCLQVLLNCLVSPEQTR